MTDAELIAELRADVKVHEMTGNGGMGRVEATRLAADRLAQLTDENARAQEDIANLTASLAAEVTESERLRAALAQGQKEDK